jgi:hypothetical protein
VGEAHVVGAGRAARRAVRLVDRLDGRRAARRLVERPDEGGAEAEQDVLVVRPRDEDDPAASALADRVQSL